MEISQRGVDLLKDLEGFRASAYRDSGGIWTIGYGCTDGVCGGQTIDRETAEVRLRFALANAEHAVQRLVRVPLTQDQFDALVIFSYNVGVGAFEGSTLLHKLNVGDYAAAAKQFTCWDRVGGQEARGLLIRREREQALFLGQA